LSEADCVACLQRRITMGHKMQEKSRFKHCACALLASATALISCGAAATAEDRDAPAVAGDYKSNASGQDPAWISYARGDLGIGQLELGGVSQAEVESNGGTFVSQSLRDTIYIGFGAGLQFNRHFRADLTGEYRSTSNLKALDNLATDLLLADGTVDGKVQSNTLYQGNLSSYVALLNGYYDLDHWRGFTPYIGVGIGLAYNQLSDLTTQSSATFTDATTGEKTVTVSSGTASSRGQVNFAWALMAGTSYDLSDNAKLDLGYRYLNLGSDVAMASGIINCTCGAVGGAIKGADLESHELRIGLRWALDQPAHNSEQ
jgi:opacity protein-like surface antigen